MVQNITITRARNYCIQISVKTKCGQPYIMSESEILIFGVKRNPYDEEYQFCKKMYPYEGCNGIYTFEIAPEDTDGMDFGTYYYDVGLQTEIGSYYSVIDISQFVLSSNITTKEDL